MKRSPFTFFSTLSLLLLIAVTTLWIRSYWSVDTLNWQADRYTSELHNSTLYSLAATEGNIRFHFQRSQTRILDVRLETVLYKLGPNGEITGVEIPKKPYPPADHSAFTYKTALSPGGSPAQLAKQTFAGFSFLHHDSLSGDEANLSFPTWLLFALFLIPPLRTVERYFRDKKLTNDPHREMLTA